MAQNTEYGGFWARLVALIIDDAIVFIIMLAALLAMGIAGATVGMESMMGAVASLVATFVPLLYWAVLESSSRQATFGKRIMGLEVTDLEGNRLSFLRAFLRTLAKIISSIPFGLGFLIAAFTARKQALHDIIVKTLVVRSGPSQLWKVIVALIVGLVLMVASAAGLFYYVLMPMFQKGVDTAMKDAMKGAPPMKSIPAPPGKAPPPQAKPAAPAAKEVPNSEFDAIAGKPLTGLDKPNTTRVGPAILELSTVFPTSFWIRVHLPAIKDLEAAPGPEITVTRVLDASGQDYHDAASAFEKGMFLRASLSSDSASVPHLSGLRSVQIKPGLSEQALQKVEGQMRIAIPVDTKQVAFEAGEIGKEKAVHGAAVALKSLSGAVAVLHYRGASRNMLGVRGYGKNGAPVAIESRQLPSDNQTVDMDLQVKFKEPVSKVEAIVAAGMVERQFPFSLARGAVAGPPPTATAATKPAVPTPGTPTAASAVPPPASSKVAAATSEPAKPAPAAQKSAPAKSVAATPPPAQVAKADKTTAAAPPPAKVDKAGKPTAAAPSTAQVAKADKPTAAAPPPAKLARTEKPAAAMPPVAQAKMDSEPKVRRAPRRRVSRPAALPAPAPAVATAPAAEPAVITPKYNDVMTAVMVGDEDAVTQLLDLGWWVDKPSSDGFTPLMAAVMNRNARMVQMLLARGANPNAQAPGGVTALRLARDRNDAATAAILEQLGAR